VKRSASRAGGLVNPGMFQCIGLNIQGVSPQKGIGIPGHKLKSSRKSTDEVVEKELTNVFLFSSL
jgi:hypothetical protein